MAGLAFPQHPAAAPASSKGCNRDEVILAQLPLSCYMSFSCEKALRMQLIIYANCLITEFPRSLSLSRSHYIYLFAFYFLCAWNSRYSFFSYFSLLCFACKLRVALMAKVKGEFMGHLTSSAVAVVFVSIVRMKLNIIMNTAKQLQRLKLWHSTAKNIRAEHKVNATGKNHSD